MEKLESILKLNENNYTIWKFQIKVILLSKSLYDVCTGIEKCPEDDKEKEGKWRSKDAKAQEVIITRIEESLIIHVMNCDTAFEMWSKLELLFEKKSDLSRHLLQTQFFNLTYNESGSMSEFIAKINNLRAQLLRKGEKITDSMAITKTLMALPSTYKHFISAWESVAEQERTFDNLTSRLLMEEERVKSDQDGEVAAALVAGTRIVCHSCGKNGHLKKDCKKDIQCNYCKKYGHYMKECFFKKKKERQEYKNKRDRTATALVGVAHTHEAQEIDTEWFMDTGCTHHMCNNLNLFGEYKEINYSHLVKLGNGQQIKAAGVGTVPLQAFNGKEWEPVDLQKVLYVPELKYNLFSAMSTMEKGFEMVANDEECQFVKNIKITALARRENRLFKMLFKKPNDNMAMFTSMPDKCTSGECELHHYHKILAHQNFVHIKKVLKNNNVSFSCEKNEKDHFCEACIQGKHFRRPYPASSSRATYAGEMLHVDVCGPIETISVGGSRYFLLIKDDFSHYRTIYFLKQKSEVPERLKVFLALCINQEIKVKIIRSDGGGEIFNNSVKKLLEEHGIIHQVTVPYTPEQNGRVEREMRTVMEAARTMLKAKNCDNELWAEAVNTAVYILNRTGNGFQEKTPYELWHKNKFHISSLKGIFGATVWCHIPKIKRKKLDAKSKKGIFVGYGETTKGFKVYYPEQKLFAVEREVIFDKRSEAVVTQKSDKNYNQGWILRETEEEETENTYSQCQEKELSQEQGCTQEQCQEKKLSQEQGCTQKENELEIQEDIRVYDQVCIQPNNEEFQLGEKLHDEKNIVENASKLEENNEVRSENRQMEDFQESRTGARPKRNVKMPKRFDDYDTCFLTLDMEEPTTLREALSSTHRSNWEEAMQNEMQALEENNTWEVVDRTENMEYVDSKWVFKLKRDSKNKIKQFKARLVARGYQQKGLDYCDIYSPVVKLSTVRVLIAVCTEKNWPIFQMDVCSAFLHGEIQEDIYLLLPNNFDLPKNKICKLKKALYGLKKAPKYWYDKFHNFVIGQGFTKCESDHCLYYLNKNGYQMYVLIYVDDLLLTGSDSVMLDSFKQKLMQTFKMKDLGFVNNYLGIQIEQNLKEGITSLDQARYLENVLRKFNMSDCHEVSTPMDPNFNCEFLLKEKSESEDIEHRCRQVIGCVMYAMLGTRPDLCSSITLLSRFQNCASNDLWICLKRLLRYIKGTLNLKLLYKRGENKNECIVTGFADADWGGSTIDRKSTSGYCLKLYGKLILWSSKKQSTVALSSTEAEYISLSLCISEACWLRNLLIELCICNNDTKMIIYEDNQSAIRSCKSLQQLKRMKHIEIKFHFIKEKIKQGIVDVVYIRTNEQIADIFTKPLNKQKFEVLRGKLLQ